jgi:alkaline phosphatase D
MEFVGTSISSDFPARFIPVIQAAMLDPTNARVKFFNGVLRGYVRCSITPEQWRSDYRVVDTVLLPTARVGTLKSFLVNANQPGSLLV